MSTLLLAGGVVGLTGLVVLGRLALRPQRFDAGWLLAWGFFFDGVAGLTTWMGWPHSPLPALVGLLLAAAATQAPRFVAAPPRLWLAPLLAWGAFLVWIGVSLAWSPMPAHGVAKTGILIVRGLLPGAATAALLRGTNRMTWVPLLWGGLAFSLIFLLIAAAPPEYRGRFALPGQNPIWGARSAVIAATVAVWLPGRRHLVLRAVVLALSAYVVFLTESRGPLVAMVGSSAFVLLFAPALSTRSRLRYAAGFLALALTTWVALSGALGTSLDSQDSRFSALAGADALQEDVTARERVQLIRQTAGVFSAQPLFGTGIGGLAERGERFYPHFLPLEVAAELGVVGLALWLLALFTGWRVARRASLSAVLFVLTLLFAFASGDLGSNWELPAFAVFMAMAGSRAVPTAVRTGAGATP